MSYVPETFDPIFTQHEDRTVTVDWPEHVPDQCYASRVVILEMDKQINTLQRIVNVLTDSGMVTRKFWHMTEHES